MFIPTTAVLLSGTAGDGSRLMTGKKLEMGEVKHMITQF